MIPAEILQALIPDRDPEDDFPRDPRLVDLDTERPERRIGLWSAYLRDRLRAQANEDRRLSKLLDKAGFIATGIHRVLSPNDSRSSEGFPVIAGYQFGAVLFGADPGGDSDGDGFDSFLPQYLPLERGRLQAPVVQTTMAFRPQAYAAVEGHVAAFYRSGDGRDLGLTAGHVVGRFWKGQPVPIACRDCSTRAVMAAGPPGLIDAATVQFTCGGPIDEYDAMPIVRHAVEGETVYLHLGDSGRRQATVMMSLSSAAEIKSAAIPMHFLTDMHGIPGDSGSLVAADHPDDGSADLIGIYLGDAHCEARNNVFTTYGYALDLQQAADMFGASNLKGLFNE